jgi:hypothetical protein
MSTLVLVTSGLLGATTMNWTPDDKEIWKKAVKRVVTTPPCCGACSLLSMNEGRKAYKYVIGEEQSEEAKKAYMDHEQKLLEAFRYFNPARYDFWFGKSSKEEKKDEK